MIDYRLLGPIEAGVDGRPLDIGGRRQRALLAVLLLSANEPVSRDCLAERLWGERPISIRAWEPAPEPARTPPLQRRGQQVTAHLAVLDAVAGDLPVVTGLQCLQETELGARADEGVEIRTSRLIRPCCREK